MSKTTSINKETDSKEKQTKLTYEQLEQVARDLNMQRNQLQAQLQRANQIISEFNDLGMLMSILNLSGNFNSDFIVRCTDRVEKMVTVALDGYDKMEVEEKAAKKEETTEQ